MKKKVLSLTLATVLALSMTACGGSSEPTRPDVTMSIYAHTLKNNDVHCCEAVTKVLPTMPKRRTG